MYTESASHKSQRLHLYKAFSSAFSYPDEPFFQVFPHLRKRKAEVLATYDRLFRARGIWLFTTEYTAKGGFQRSLSLSDIMGFYKAFGLALEKERPDSLWVELEFMHFLIFKALHAERNPEAIPGDKVSLCIDAQRKFFTEHLFPGARAISKRIMADEDPGVYHELTEELLHFLEQDDGYMNQQA
jgi:TorA maturation chaperone TorD